MFFASNGQVRISAGKPHDFHTGNETIKTIQRFALIATIALLSPFTAQASIVTWGAAQNTNATTDIRTVGTLHSAFNAGQTAVTVNGVSFASASPFEFTTGNTAFLATDTGNTDFNRLLGEASFEFDALTDDDLEGTIDLGTFTSGLTYEVQVFFTDQRANLNNRSIIYGSEDTNGTGGTVEVLGDPNMNTSAPYGQFAIGTFVADGDDPDLTVLGGANGAVAQINAWQVRVVPEPSSLLMFGVCTLGLMYRRRNI